jgi:hypothetical protein
LRDAQLKPQDQKKTAENNKFFRLRDASLNPQVSKAENSEENLQFLGL